MRAMHRGGPYHPPLWRCVTVCDDESDCEQCTEVGLIIHHYGVVTVCDDESQCVQCTEVGLIIHHYGVVTVCS